jgi:hypothetical protein
MKAFLLIIPLWCLCASSSLADIAGTLGTQCVTITPETADPSIPASVAQYDKTSAKAFYCLALVERRQGGSSETPIDADIQRVFIFPTVHGRYSIRLLDLPEGLGRGGF